MSLQPAQLYANELKIKFANIAYDPYYMFAECGYTNEYSPSDSNWNKHEFVSLNSKGEVVGYIKYNVYRNNYSVGGLYIVNFLKCASFGLDIAQSIDDIFCKYGFNKLSYSVYIGNPIEVTYDKLTSKYGGRIVGVKEKEDRLLDGNFYDLKMYELFKNNYIEHRPNKFILNNK